MAVIGSSPDDDDDLRRLEQVAFMDGVTVEQLTARSVREGLIRQRRLSVAAKDVHPSAEYTEWCRKNPGRKIELGDFGEMVTIELLAKYQQSGRNVFTNVRNLNYPTRNNKYADVLTDMFEKGGRRRLAIGVDTRNIYESKRGPIKNSRVIKLDRFGNPSLNKRYTISKRDQRHARQQEVYHEAEAAWVAVQVDTSKNTYSAYFGFLDDRVCRRNCIDMKPEDVARYVCLGHDILADFDISHLSNTDWVPTFGTRQAACTRSGTDPTWEPMRRPRNIG
jgi:hypothetical protein